jgi:glucokinase
VIVAADVGGTKIHWALYPEGAGPREPRHELKLPSREFASLEESLRVFLDDGARAGARGPVRRAAIGVAGPVIGKRVDTTNLPWDVDSTSLSTALGGARVRLLNDLEATAWGLGTLGTGDLHVLQNGVPLEGNRALVAAGTGLGEALLIRDEQGWHASASEGGHTDFGPRDPVEDELLVWLRERYGRVSYERILSGPGLADLYRFHAATGRGEADARVADEFAAADDPAVVVSAAALTGRCERCVVTLRRFVSVYGAEAGNLALKSLSVNGLFVAGGIAPRILDFLDVGFMASFVAKGRLSSVVERMPVAVVMRPEVALWGAASVALAHSDQPA